MNDNAKDLLEDFINGLIEKTIRDFESRWSEIEIDLYFAETFEVIGGLLSRQATLLIEMAKSPSIWNGHSAPLFLRCMTDLHITLAWILNSPDDRAKKYILYGLGQEKLLIEHYSANLDENDNEELRNLVDVKKTWLESQRREFMTEVNVGNWAQLDNRKMAKEAECEDLYKFAYVPFSMAAHNMWNHISMYNMTPCVNPLHKNHLRPCILEPPGDLDFLFRAVKYFDKTTRNFDEKMKLSIDSDYLLDWWAEEVEKIRDK